MKQISLPKEDGNNKKHMNDPLIHERRKISGSKN